MARRHSAPRRSESVDAYLRGTRALAAVAVLALAGGVLSDALADSFWAGHTLLAGLVASVVVVMLTVLNAYVATMHFNGQSTVELNGDRATGEGYCLAHHLTEAEDGSRTLMVASIRYLDTFVKQDGAWLFAERRLMVNWTDTRPSVA